MQKWNERNQLDMTSQTLREARKYEEAAEKMIKEETLSIEIIKKDNLTNEFDLNGKIVKLDVEKA